VDHVQTPHFNIWLTLFQISSKSVYFRQCYCRMREDRFCVEAYLQYRLLEPIIKAFPLILLSTQNLVFLCPSKLLLATYIPLHIHHGCHYCTSHCCILWCTHFAKYLAVSLLMLQPFSASPCLTAPSPLFCHHFHFPIAKFFVLLIPVFIAALPSLVELAVK